jgi:hypothetical protein
MTSLLLRFFPCCLFLVCSCFLGLRRLRGVRYPISIISIMSSALITCFLIHVSMKDCIRLNYVYVIAGARQIFQKLFFFLFDKENFPRK